VQRVCTYRPILAASLENIMTEDQLKLFEGVKALGVEVHDHPWGCLLHRPDPNGISGAPWQMIHVRADGTVWFFAEVDEGTTPSTAADDGIQPDEVANTLAEVAHVTFRALINDELDEEDWLREDLILFMIGQGWEVFHGSSEGRIRHGNNHDLIYGSWFEAAKACIATASEF
jgi:hypothetical protein